MDHCKLITGPLGETDPVIPRLLHMIWVGHSDPPSFFRTHVEQWRTVMPDWTVRVWRNADLHEWEFSKPLLERIHLAEKGVQKADLMRYAIVERHGGVYVDADVVPHRSLEPIRAMGRPVVLCHDLPLTWQYIACGFFAAAPHHPLMIKACDLAMKATLNTADIHMKTGPRLLGEAVWTTKPDEPYALLPIHAFYRNMKSQKSIHNVLLTEDRPDRFGSHTYAKLWAV